MNLLIVTSNLPYPLGTGGNQAQFNMIDFLRKKNVNITIVFNLNRVNSKDNLEKLKLLWKDVTFYPYNWKNKNDFVNLFLLKAFKKVRNKFSVKERPFKIYDTFIGDMYSENFINYINAVIEEQNIDIIQIDFRVFLPLIYCIPNKIKTVFVQHEIQFIRNKLILELSSNDTSYQHFLYKKMMHDEIAAMNQYNMIITFTEKDKRILLDNGISQRIEISPAAISNTIDSARFTLCQNKLVFIGGSSHFPNKDGLLWFLDSVWHHIQAKRPDIVLNIIGSWTNKEQIILNKRYKNIRFLGFVENLSDVLSDAILIVPIRIASGMRMKIVEAANLGNPFITTVAGVEGLKFNNERDCFIEDDGLLFAEKTIKLVEDVELQRKFSVNSKKVFDAYYSVAVLGEKRLSLLKSLE
jgi:hypothetical protein